MKKINLTIPEPCHERWDKMEKEEKGKFCNACQKTVVDFTNMSDRQIAEFFKKPPSSVCGRFQQDQLNRDLSMPRKRLPWLKYFLQITLPAFLFAARANAQGRVKVTDTTHQVCVKPEPKNFPAKSLHELIEIKGRITDEKGEPMAYVSVLNKKGNEGTVSDSDGTFTLKVKKGSVIIVSYVGMETKEIIANDTTDKNIVLVGMDNWDLIIVGYVTTTAKPQKKHPIIPKIFDSAFTRFSVFPNPVCPGQQFTIETKKFATGVYAFELIHVNGEIVQSSEITIDKKSTSFNFILKPTAAGIYFVRLTNKKTGRTYSEKLVVE